MYVVGPSISWAETPRLPCRWSLAPGGLDTLALLVASSSVSLAPRDSHTDQNRPMVSLAVGQDPLVPPVDNSSCDLTLRGTHPYVAPKPLYPLKCSITWLDTREQSHTDLHTLTRSSCRHVISTHPGLSRCRHPRQTVPMTSGPTPVTGTTETGTTATCGLTPVAGP